jgi:anaerobic selenocysteine-containing dehydrogenase
MTTRSVHSYCRICQAHCGIIVELDGEQVVRVSGDRDHPVSAGYTCSKGRALGEAHHSPDRLDLPLLHGQPAPWDDVLADLGARLRTILDDHGPDAIACYRSTGWVLDTNGRGVVDRWVRAIGTRQLYSPATIDTPNRTLVPDLVVGAPFLQPVVDWTGTELLVVLGHNLVVSHGHATSVPDPVRRLRSIQERGGKVIVADPRLTETARLADVHVQLRPGSDAALAAFLVRLRLEQRSDAAYLATCADPASVDRLREATAAFDRDTAARMCDVDPGVLDQVADIVLAVDRLSFITGTGVSMGPVANAAEWLGWALGAVTGSLDRSGGMLFNPGVLRPQSETGPVAMDRVTGPPPASRPELQHAYGEYPTAILTDEILAGNVRALISFGGNPMASFPDSVKTKKALAALDVFAVTELRHTQSTAVATHVLATTDQLERPDVTFFMDGAFPIPFAQYTPAVVHDVGARLPLSQAMGGLARHMGMEIAGVTDVIDEDELIGKIIRRSRVPFEQLRSAPSGVVVEDAPREWLIPDKVPRGRLDLAPDALVAELHRWVEVEARSGAGAPGSDLALICRRLPHQMNSDLQELPSQQRAPFPTLLMSPADAGERGLAEGEVVTVSNRNGSTSAVLEVTDRIRSGVVSLPHSWRDPDVNQLTSTDDLDPITGMPRFTALGVTVLASGG